MSEFKLPDVGEGLTEAEIVSWKVKAGDSVEINDIIVEIETAKSIVELPSPFAGTVLALMVDEGEMVQVGTPIISIGSADEELGLIIAHARSLPQSNATHPASELRVLGQETPIRLGRALPLTGREEDQRVLVHDVAPELVRRALALAAERHDPRARRPERRRHSLQPWADSATPGGTAPRRRSS